MDFESSSESEVSYMYLIWII